MIFRTVRAGTLLVAAAVTALGVNGCGNGFEESSGGSASDPDKPQVVTAFYPLQYATERIAGEHAEVSDLTKPGAEPHDLELGPRDVGTVVQADLAVYLKGFQPSVDSAVAESDNGFDVGRFANLQTPSEQRAGQHGGDAHQDRESHKDHEGHEHGDGGHEHGGTDPHFWLDPIRYADVAREIANQLGTADPDNAKAYDRRARDLVADLEQLDQEYEQGLASCRNHDLVVSHEAFGYLTARYGFTQYGITGLDPHSEPSPRKIAELVSLARDHQVSAIYHETLVSEDTARTIADEVGVDVAVLDPVEGLTDDSAGNDYMQVMRSNLQTLQKGQDCT